MTAQERFERVRAEWLAISRPRVPSWDRFKAVKAEADDLIDRGLWVSGPSDLLSVLRRQRDELSHSRLIAWLLVPTNRHGLGRRFLTAFLDHVWTGEALLRTGTVTVDTEESASGIDIDGQLHEARADIVVRGQGVTVIIENKVDAGEQPDQCERLFWAFDGDAPIVKWLFLAPTARTPVTATSDAARAAWASLSYAELRKILARALDASAVDPSIGRATVHQYVSTLVNAVSRPS